LCTGQCVQINLGIGHETSHHIGWTDIHCILTVHGMGTSVERVCGIRTAISAHLCACTGTPGAFGQGVKIFCGLLRNLIGL
jgi:hypothetical protein